MLSISTGHSAGYLTDQVGAGMESYYTGAVGGGGAARAVVGQGRRGAGPGRARSTPRSCTPSTGVPGPARRAVRRPGDPGRAAVLGRAAEAVPDPGAGRRRTVSASTPPSTRVHPTPEQVQAWRIEAERDTPKAVGFYDLTFSPDKSVTVLHTAFVRAGHEAHEAGDAEAAQRGSGPPPRSRTPSWTPCAAGLDYVERDAGYTRTGRHGAAAAPGGGRTPRP